MRYHGVLTGKREEADVGLTKKMIILANHKDNAPAKLNDKVVVIGNL